MDTSMESMILQEFIRMAPYIPLFIEEPVSVAITNKVTFIYNQPCDELPVKVDIGNPFPPGSTPGAVIESGERIAREVSAKVYGIPFMSYAIPLRENDEVVGCLMIAKSIEKIKSAKEAIANLSAEVEQVAAAVGEITEAVQISSENNQIVYDLMEKLLEETEKMNHILSVINKLSNTTKILGLNAAIEAARAGTAGKGFSVVAKEIERMSSSTTHSAQEIGTMLGAVEEDVTVVNEKVKDTTDSFTQQAAALQQIAATMQNLNANVKMLESYMQQL